MSAVQSLMSVGEIPLTSPHALSLLSYNIQTGVETRDFHEYVTKSWKHLLPLRERISNLNQIAALAIDALGELGVGLERVVGLAPDLLLTPPRYPGGSRAEDVYRMLEERGWRVHQDASGNTLLVPVGGTTTPSSDGATVDAFARAEAATDLTLDDLVQLFATRALVHLAMDNRGAMAADLARLLALAPDHELDPRTAPDARRTRISCVTVRSSSRPSWSTRRTWAPDNPCCRWASDR